MMPDQEVDWFVQEGTAQEETCVQGIPDLGCEQ